MSKKAGAHLVNGSELTVENDRFFYVDYKGKKERVGAVYRRISDEYLDPMHFNPESVIGIPHIFDAYRKGNVALLNAPGNGIADDKGIYYFVPKMIRYYFGEEPVLSNAPTYLPLLVSSSHVFQLLPCLGLEECHPFVNIMEAVFVGCQFCVV